MTMRDDLTLRLRLDTPFYTLKNRRLREEAANEIERLRALAANETQQELIAALKGLSDMYASTWDRVDGGLTMMGWGVERFERAHGVALALLQKLGAK